MKEFEEEPCYGRDIERLRVMWKIASLASLLEPSLGLFSLCEGLVASFECEPTASLARGSALEEPYVCWRAIRRAALLALLSPSCLASVVWRRAHVYGIACA